MSKLWNKSYVLHLWLVTASWWQMVGISGAEPINEAAIKAITELLTEEERQMMNEKLAPYLIKLKEKEEELWPELKALIEEKINSFTKKYNSLAAQPADTGKIQNDATGKRSEERKDEHKQLKEQIIAPMKEEMPTDETRYKSATRKSEISEDEMEQSVKQINELIKSAAPEDETKDGLATEPDTMNEDEGEEGEELDPFIEDMRAPLDMLVPEMQFSEQDTERSIDMQPAGLEKTLEDPTEKGTSSGVEQTDETKDGQMTEQNEKGRNELGEKITSPTEDKALLDESQDIEELPRKIDELESYVKEIKKNLDLLVPKMQLSMEQIKTSFEMKSAETKQNIENDLTEEGNSPSANQLPLFLRMPMGLGLGMGNMLTQLGMPLAGLNGMLHGMKLPGQAPEMNSGSGHYQRQFQQSYRAQDNINKEESFEDGRHHHHHQYAQNRKHHDDDHHHHEKEIDNYVQR